jgi:UDP:flavonoid glycosyltransferase YjiC (YdhE family)
MRVAFTSFPATGHLLPLVPMARAAHEAGNDVLIVAGEDQRALSSGLPFRASGPSSSELLAESQRRWSVDLLGEDVAVAHDAALQLFTGLRAELSFDSWCEALGEFRPDLIVAEIWDYVAPLVASRLGLQLATFSHSPGTPADEPLAVASQNTFERYGLEPPRPLAFVQQWPDWLQPEGHAAAPAELPIGFDRMEDATAVPESGQAAVLVTLGTVVPSRPVLEQIVDCALQTDARLIVTTLSGESPDSFDFDPERVSVVGFTPFDQLLAEVRAVVAAGGSGTTLGSLRRGRPIVFVPQLANQPVIAEAVERQGAGIVCEEPADVKRSLERVLGDPTYTAAAHRAAEALSHRPTPDRTWASLRERC